MSAIIIFANKSLKIMKYGFSDRFLHALAYAILTFLIYLPVKYNLSFKHRFLISLAISIGFGFLDEINQLRIKTRTFDLNDIKYNLVGTVIILFIIKISELIYQKIKNS